MLWTTTNASAPAIAAMPAILAGRRQDADRDLRAGRGLRRLDRLLDLLCVLLTEHYHRPDEPPPPKLPPPPLKPPPPLEPPELLPE